MGKILVTGVAGLIASRTAEQLISAGHSVVGIDNLNDAYDVRLKQARLEPLISSARFAFHALDIENFTAVSDLFEVHEFDAVVHLAGRAGVRYSMENPHVYLATNATGTLHVLEAMRHRKVTKLVMASTSSLYAGQPVPFVETLPVNTPISPYAASKKAAEALAYTYHHLFGLDVSVLRYFTVYGPAGRPDMAVFRFVKWIDEGRPIELYGDGTQSRDFTYVDDIAAGTIAALKPVGYEIINLGGGRRPWTLNEMIGLLENLLGKSARIERYPVHKADMTETHADIRKAGSLLGWQPRVDLPEGLQKTVAWYRENYDWAREIRTDGRSPWEQAQNDGPIERTSIRGFFSGLSGNDGFVLQPS
jgi:UDP-glucuronate 4-epimerase